ncbi:hypothetical protein [Azospirillum doebereinerae]
MNGASFFVTNLPSETFAPANELKSSAFHGGSFLNFFSSRFSALAVDTTANAE